MTIAPIPPISSLRLRLDRGADPACVSTDSARPTTAAPPFPVGGVWSGLGSLPCSVMSGTVTRMMNRIGKNLLARYSQPKFNHKRPRTPARRPPPVVTNGAQPTHDSCQSNVRGRRCVGFHSNPFGVSGHRPGRVIMKIVVSGGTGLIGSKTVAILRQGGHELVAASRKRRQHHHRRGAQRRNGRRAGGDRSRQFTLF